MHPNKTFILAHLSDPHLACHRGIRFSDIRNKRLLGYVKWHLIRKSGHREKMFTAMIEDVRSRRPDHIVVTGDLTHMGLPAEFARAKEFLNALGSPSRVTVVPGNHDAYVDGALDGRLAEWADYMASDGLNVGSGTDAAASVIFPSLRVRDNVALIGVSTAQPCSTFLAVGCLGSEQLQRLEQMLFAAGRKGLFRIVLIHHPPISGVVSRRKRLTDAAAFHEILQRSGAELILHGHAHHPSESFIEIPDGRIPVVGVPSASAASEDSRRRARYHQYRVTRRADGWDTRICVRGYSNRDKSFRTENEYHLAP